MSTNKRAVIYCRVSTKEQVEEGNSLVTQQKICKEYALKNGYEIVETYIEQGESAKNKDRPELQRLIDFCTNKKNCIGAVISYKVDRIARNIDDYRYIRVLLKKYGVEIKSTSEYFEDTPAGRFMENIIANVAQFDNDVRTERSVGGMRDAMREGRYVWGASFGYSNTKIGGKATIAPNDKALVIQKFFSEVAQNKDPIDVIRKRLFNEGLATKSGKPLTRSHSYRILKNELYAGWIIKFGERHKGLFEPIVSEDIFEQVQRVLEHRSRKSVIYQRENPDFPLRRFVLHPNGQKLTGAWAQGRRQKYPYYRFLGVNNPGLRKQELESNFKAFIDRYAISSEHLDYFKEALKQAYESGIRTEFLEAQKIRAYISELTDRQTSLIIKNSKGVISDSVLRTQLELMENELLQANARLIGLPDAVDNIDELFSFVAQYLAKPSKIWDSASLQQKVKLQWFQFPKGIVLENGNFRTAEVANIFKVKDIFLPHLSSRVNSKGQKYEQPTQNDCRETRDLIEQSCQRYVAEMSSLVEILKLKSE